MQICNHVRDTLGHYSEIWFSRTKKKYAIPFFFLNCNIWGKTETYLVSFCLNSFRDLTLQITFNSRDRSTLNEILSLIGQSCVWQIFLINFAYPLRAYHFPYNAIANFSLSAFLGERSNNDHQIAHLLQSWKLQRYLS